MKKILSLILFALLLLPLEGQGILRANAFYTTASVIADTTTYKGVIGDGNTVGWYIAEETGDLTKDATDSVSVWKDHLGSGNDLVAPEGTPENKTEPIWSAAGITFNGTTNYMYKSFTWAQPNMIYIVFKSITWTYNDFIFFNQGTGEIGLRQAGTTPGLRLYSSTTSSSASTTLAVGDWGIVRMLAINNAGEFIVNNDASLSWSPGSRNMGGLWIGSNDTPDGYANCIIAEIICRKVHDSSAHEALIYNYLKDKYGL